MWDATPKDVACQGTDDNTSDECGRELIVEQPDLLRGDVLRVGIGGSTL